MSGPEAPGSFAREQIARDFVWASLGQGGVYLRMIQANIARSALTCLKRRYEMQSVG
jgi:hypothetical protein